jgi:O-antigen/teichoic acid export membrane protein
MQDAAKIMKGALKLIASDSLVYGVGSALNGLAGILMIPVLVRSLQAAEYGRYAIAEMFIAGLVVLLGMGFGATFPSHYFNRSVETRRDFAVAAFTVFLLVAAGYSAIFFVFLKAYGSVVAPQLSPEMYALVAAIALIEVTWAFLALMLRAQSRRWRFVLMSFVQFALSLSITILLIKGFQFREEAILLGRLFASGAVVLLSVDAIRSCRPMLQWAAALKLVRLGFAIIPATISAVWISMSPRYFLENLSTLSDVGTYAMSAKIAGLISLFIVQPFGMAWSTVLYRIHERGDAKAIYARVLTYYWTFGLLSAFSVALAAPEIADLLGKEEFTISPEVISVAALAIIASGLTYPVNLGPHLKKRLFIPVPVFIAGAIGAFAIGPALTIKFGVIGAAASLAIIYIAQAFVLGIISGRLYRVNWEWGRLLKVTVTLPIIYLIYVKSAAFVDWPFLLRPFAYAVTTGLVLIVVRFLNKGELNALLSFQVKILKKT